MREAAYRDDFIATYKRAHHTSAAFFLRSRTSTVILHRFLHRCLHSLFLKLLADKRTRTYQTRPQSTTQPLITYHFQRLTDVLCVHYKYISLSTDLLDYYRAPHYASKSIIVAGVFSSVQLCVF